MTQGQLANLSTRECEQMHDCRYDDLVDARGFLVAKTTATNPSYTHVILGKECGWPENEAYFTRVGKDYPVAAEYQGHYNMDRETAFKDFEDRIKRGY